MRDTDRRAHFRYRDPDSGTMHILIKNGEAEEPITGLMVNESYAGLACVYVGPGVAPNAEVIWQETDEVRTPCKVLRCQKLYTDVFLLALQIVD